MSDIEEVSSSDSGSDDDVEVDYIKGGKAKKNMKFNEENENDDEEGSESDVSDGEEKDDSDAESDADSTGSASDGEFADSILKQNLGALSGDDEDDEDDDDDDEDEDEYFRKFDDNMKANVISEYHPEMLHHNYEEIEALTRITYVDEVISDPLHRTIPILTKYEKARVLGERAKQINSGAKPFVPVDETLIDGYLIALKELEEKKIPFIIRRPLPSGACEYWKLKDLEML